MHIKFWMLINYKQPAPGRYPGKEDEMDKQQFIDFLNQHYGDSDIFDSPSIEIVGLPQDNTLIGTTFGSATHLIRLKASFYETHNLSVTIKKRYEAE